MENNRLDKILLVAFLEDSRPAAYEITSRLKEFGYSSDICYAKHEGCEDPELLADIHLSKDADLSSYKGIVFLDDGSDSDACATLAKKAGKDKIVVGAYSHGCKIVADAGLMDDQFVSAMIPEDMRKGAKAVKAPAVRSDNLVTSFGNCPLGFAVLLIDALGGEIKKVVESTKDPVLIPRSALVVSRLGRWAEYWGLSERLAERKAVLLLADWDDIDASRKIASRFMAIGPTIPNGVVLVERPCVLPASTWFKQSSIGIEETIKAIEALEKAGCKNLNSAETVRTASDKLETAKLLSPICFQGNPRKYEDKTVREAADEMLEPGVRWAKPICSSLGKGVIRIQGRGKTVIVSKRQGRDVAHKITERKGLEAILRKAFNRGPFMVQDDLGAMHLGDKNFELRFIMRRMAEGWKPSCEIARAGRLISNPDLALGASSCACSAEQATKAVFGSDWKACLDKARDIAVAACIAFQSGLRDPDGANELGIDITFSGQEPNVVEINSIPDLTFVDMAVSGKNGLMALAYSMGTEPEHAYTDVTLEDQDASRADAVDTLYSRLNDKSYRRLLEREMAHQGMHPQPGWQIAMLEHGKFERIPVKEALGLLKNDISFYLSKFDDAHDHGQEADARNYSQIVLKTRHKIRLLYEYLYLETRDKDFVKTADYAFNFTGDEIDLPMPYGSVSGPFSNIRVPVRYIPWNDNDGPIEPFRFPEETLKKLSRYAPEYYGHYLGPFEEDSGFFAGFNTLHHDDPTPWNEIEDGEGFYPSRKQLMH